MMTRYCVRKLCYNKIYLRGPAAPPQPAQCVNSRPAAQCLANGIQCHAFETKTKVNVAK